MYVLYVAVSGNDKRMISLQKAVGKFVADGIGFLRRNFARHEGLAHLISDNFMLLRSPGVGLILATGQSKFCVSGMRITGIGGDEFTVLCFAWIGCIVEPRREGLYGGFAFANVHGDDASDSDRQDSFLKNQMGANGISFAGVVYLIINRNLRRRVMIIAVDKTSLSEAATVHSISWKKSHCSFCSASFIEQHTPERQREYLERKMNVGSKIFMLVEEMPIGIVSVTDSLIEDLYILPDKQNMGYGTKLLQFAVSQCIGTPTLWILENNINAERLYLRMGFEKTGRKNTISNGLDEIEFALT